MGQAINERPFFSGKINFPLWEEWGLPCRLPTSTNQVIPQFDYSKATFLGDSETVIKFCHDKCATSLVPWFFVQY